MLPKIIAVKLRIYFVYNQAVPALLYNNKIVAHEQRLIDYFELMYAKTM